MTKELGYAMGSVIVWAGWACAAVVLYRGLAWIISGHKRSLAWPLAGAAVMLGMGQVAMPSKGLAFPVFWVILPFAGWGIVACGVGLVLQLVHCLFTLHAERLRHLNNAAAFAAGVAVFGYLFASDAANEFKILTGTVPLTPTLAGAGVSLAFLAVLAMAYATRSARAARLSKGLITHAALVAGSCVFALPFAYMLATSFKEDADMSSPEGIVWIPRVEQTIPYRDPKNPLYEGTFNGVTVQGTVIDKRHTQVKLDVSRPFSMRGVVIDTDFAQLKVVPRDVPVVTATIGGVPATGFIAEELEDGSRRVVFTGPPSLKGQERVLSMSEAPKVRRPGLRWANYTEALGFLPAASRLGFVYLRNTLFIALLSVIGAILSSSLVAYAFSRMRFPARNSLFTILLATMMLPGAVTLMPQFLIFRSLGWIDTLAPLWVPAFAGSAFNIFMLRQFFRQIPLELEDAAKIDGCSYLGSFWRVMLPQIKPALAVIFVWTFVGAWNNFMGPLIYLNSHENLPLSYALSLFNSDRSGEPGILMAFAVMTVLPILGLFFALQRYFIEGVSLSGFGGR